MAGYGGDFLYRLLREVDCPLTDGIMAKDTSSDQTAAYHVRYGSRPFCATRWISTCASEKALKQLIEKKIKKRKEGTFLKDSCFRCVKIDRSKLKSYAKKCEVINDLYEVSKDSTGRIVPPEEKTGMILDFTDSNVMDKYLTTQMQRNFANHDEEVLVEKFIPRHCCIEVWDGEILHQIPLLLKNEIGEKEFVSLHEYNMRLQPITQTQFVDSQISLITAKMGATHISYGPPLGNLYQQSNHLPEQPRQMPMLPVYLPTCLRNPSLGNLYQQSNHIPEQTIQMPYMLPYLYYSQTCLHNRLLPVPLFQFEKKSILFKH